MNPNKRFNQNDPSGSAPTPLLTAARMKALLVGLVIGLVLFGVGDYYLVWAEADKAANQQTQLSALERENEELERLIGTPEQYDAWKKQCEAEEAEFAEALEAVPGEQELAVALSELETVMKNTGVNLVSFTPGKAATAAEIAPNPSQPPADAKGDKKGDGKDEKPAGPPPVQIQARPIDVTVRANFRTYQSLLNALAGHQRVLTTEGFTMTSAPSGPGYTLTSKMHLKVYFKQVPPPAAAPAEKK